MSSKLMSLCIGLVAVGSIANANVIKASMDGSKESISGVGNISKTTVLAISGGVASSLESTADAISSTGEKVKDATMYVLDSSPIESSKASSNSLVDSSRYVITSTGEMLKVVWDGSVMLIQEPIATMGASSKAVKRGAEKMIEVTVDSSGKVYDVTGKTLKNAYNEDVSLVRDGSSKILMASKNAIVVSLDASKTVLSFVIVDSAYDSVATSSVTLNESMLDLSQGEIKEALKAIFVDLPRDLFEAGTTSGLQYQD